MDADERDVKPRRAYDASRRRATAQLSRQSIIDVAARRFLSGGYAATTISAIAREAGVSADTIYKTFGGKPGLVRAILDRALEGTGPVPAERRSDALHERENDPRAIIAGWGKLVAEVAPLGAPVALLVRDAAVSDPELRALAAEIDAARHRRMTLNARRLRDRGHLRAGVSLSRAADVLWTYSSPELYELLVIRRGWTARRYGKFVGDAMAAALL